MQVSRRKALSPFLGLAQPEQPVHSHDSHIRISVSAAHRSCPRIRARPLLKHTGATRALRYWFMQSRAPLKEVLMKPRERNCGQMSGRGGGEPRLVLFSWQSRDLPRQGARNPARPPKLHQENENKRN